MSQFVRDTRIALIYEGANGIQALDLVGRKLARKGGRALMTLNTEIDTFLGENADNEGVSDFMDGLKDAKMMGLTTLAYMWAKMAVVAQAAIDSGSNDEYYTNKIITGRYFVLRMLPMMDAHLAKIKTGAEPVMALEAARQQKGIAMRKKRSSTRVIQNETQRYKLG